MGSLRHRKEKPEPLERQKRKFLQRFKERHSLRLHMSLILCATVCGGLLATNGLHLFHLENVMIRYPFTVACAYLVFLAAVKLWLLYVGSPHPAGKRSDDVLDLVDALPDLSSLPAPSPDSLCRHGVEAIRSGGGRFGGGGATGGFDGGHVTIDCESAVPGVADHGGGLADTVGDIAGEAVSAVDDEKAVAAIVVLAVLGVLLAVTIGAGVFLIYEAPVILSETAFEVVLAASLVRGARRIDSSDWVGSVVKATWLPFAATFTLAFLAGCLIHQFYPNATSLAELITELTRL